MLAVENTETVDETRVEAVDVEPMDVVNEDDNDVENADNEEADTGEYMANMLTFIRQNAGELREEARKTNKGSGTTATAVFHKYVSGAGRDKVELDEVPKARSGGTSQGGSWYSNTVLLMLDSIHASTSVKRLGEKSYTIDAEVYVKPADYAKVEALLKDAETSMFWDPETETVAKRVDYPVFAGGFYEGAIFVFEETKLAVFSTVDTETRMPRIRDGAKVNVENIKAKVNLVPYLKKNKKDKTDEGRWILREYFSFTCGSIEPTADPVVSWAGYYEQSMDRSMPVCVDIRDVQAGTAQMPATFYVNTAAGGTFSDGNSVTRITLPAGSGDFTYNEKPRYICTVMELGTRDGKNQTCELTLTGWEDTAKMFGLDTTPDPESTKDKHSSAYDSLMRAHTLTAHFMCEYDEERSMALPKNNPELVANREQNKQYTNGSYAARIKHVAVDYRDTLVKRGIPITKEKLLSLFAEANRGKPSAEKMFKKITEDGKDVYHFKSVLDGRNPVCNNGDYSDVIPLGSGERPTHQTEDASVFLDKEGATFYALTSMPKELAGNYGTAEEGDAEFERQKAELGSKFKYVTFVVQKQDVLQKMRK